MSVASAIADLAATDLEALHATLHEAWKDSVERRQRAEGVLAWSAVFAARYGRPLAESSGRYVSDLEEVAEVQAGWCRLCDYAYARLTKERPRAQAVAA